MSMPTTKDNRVQMNMYMTKEMKKLIELVAAKDNRQPGNWIMRTVIVALMQQGYKNDLAKAGVRL